MSKAGAELKCATTFAALSLLGSVPMVLAWRYFFKFSLQPLWLIGLQDAAFILIAAGILWVALSQSPRLSGRCRLKAALAFLLVYHLFPIYDNVLATIYLVPEPLRHWYSYQLLAGFAGVVFGFYVYVVGIGMLVGWLTRRICECARVS